MSILKKITRLFEHHGDRVDITVDGNTTTVFAFIRPMLYKNKMYADNSFSSLGEIDESCFLYIGPYVAGMEDKNSLIKSGGKGYAVAKLSPINYRGERLFVRGILRYRISGGGIVGN